LDLSLQGPRPAPCRRLTTNSRWTGTAGTGTSGDGCQQMENEDGQAD
jgi:hypothetical protein